jgi:hypothetical protein
MDIIKSKEVKIVGAFLLITGISGSVLFLTILFPFRNIISLLNIIPIVLFLLTAYSGYLILIKESENGLVYGRAIVALQIIKFHILGIGYYFVTGGYLFIGFNNLNFGFDFGLGTKFSVQIFDDISNVMFQLNILALVVFIYLSKLLNRIDEKTEES